MLFCRLPGEKKIRRYDFSTFSEQTLRFGGAKVSPWPSCSFSQEKSMSVPACSTPKEDYVRTINDIKAKLEVRGGKTVLSRQICGTFKVFDPEAVMEEYFASFPDMFCFMFSHPSTGYWMGASPELLLEVIGDKLAKTRALAGTRPADTIGRWSEKNIEEHRIVVEDICLRINALETPAKAEALEPYNFSYGVVEHLCTPIAIRNVADGVFPAEDVIAAIHPTPAVCGFPRPDAMRDIAEAETTPRNCYGGLITVPGNNGPLAYVVLRCVHFDERNWAVYTGSGITAASDAFDEWNETAAKATPLIELLNKY